MKKNNTIQVQYRYMIEMIYLNNKKNKTTNIKTECIKSIVIDHNYENNCMPIIYATMKLDKALVDDMIINVNTNLMIVALYKYNDLTDTKEPIEVFRDKFTYFIPDDVNKNLNLDYNEATEKEHLGNTYTEVIMGLMSINMINLNKRNIELNVSNNTIFDCVKYCTSNMKNLIIEPFVFDDTYDRIIMPAQNSINNALKFLNNYRVFYYTPYRYYQDFKYTYIISSSGKAIPKDNELYSSILVDFRDIGDANSLETGTIIDKKSKTYEVPVNYVFSNVFDNSVVNKSINKIKSVSNNGVNIRSLSNTADYSNEKMTTIRMNNDNDNMIYNLEYKNNNDNVFIYFNKNDLDTDLFTINKRITVHNINRYQHYDGDYLLSRKRECYLREDKTFVMVSMINLKRIILNNDVITEKYDF